MLTELPEAVVRAAYCGADFDPVRRVPVGYVFVPVMQGDELPLEASICVVEASGFTEVDALCAYLDRLDVPALVLVDDDSADAVVPRLRLRDDACSAKAPAAILGLRLNRLLARQSSRFDTLTGLLERQSFLARLRDILLSAGPRGPISVVIVDIDRFKRVNDEFGHGVGDQLLAGLADRLREAALPEAIVARFGGEEFAIVLGGDEERGLAQAEAICGAVRATVFEPHDIPLTVSAAVATTWEPIRRRQLLQQADEAMYAAKARGRDRVVHYGELVRKAVDTDTDVALQSFENMTRVISERIMDTIAYRGRQIFREIKQQADVDALTLLYSRRYLDRRLSHDFAASVTTGRQLAVALLDIDHFGKVNKTWGWPTGDQVLRELSEIVTRNVRAEDWVARYGGEELCLVMAGTDREAAARVLERVRATIEDHPFTSDKGDAIAVTVSVGCAQRRPNEEELGTLVARVSDRLLKAKNGGRNQVCSS
jgi:two-component system, cell cycle response regulator